MSRFLFTCWPFVGHVFPQMAIATALRAERPAHGTLQIVGLDEVRRTIEVTAIPLLASATEPIGVIAIFWPR